MKTKTLSIFNIKHVALGIAVAGLLLSATFMPVHKAQAAITEDLQAQINQLMLVIGALQAQLQIVDEEDSLICSYTWTRDLTIGSAGTDVLELKKYLNLDTETALVSTSDSNSSYYGSATAQAVSKFQTKYRSEILSPLGLVNPTGMFRSSTRAKLNALCTGSIEEYDSVRVIKAPDSPDPGSLVVTPGEEVTYMVLAFEVENNTEDEVELEEFNFSAILPHRTKGDHNDFEDYVDEIYLKDSKGNIYDEVIISSYNGGKENTHNIQADMDDFSLDSFSGERFEVYVTLEVPSDFMELPDSQRRVQLLLAGDAGYIEISPNYIEVEGRAETGLYTLFSSGALVEVVSTSVAAVDNEVTFEIEFEVTAVEEDVLISKTDAITDYSFSQSQGSQLIEADLILLQSSAGVSGNAYRVDEGDVETFTLSVLYTPEESGLYRFRAYELEYGLTARNLNELVVDVSDKFSTDDVYVSADGEDSAGEPVEEDEEDMPATDSTEQLVSHMYTCVLGRTGSKTHTQNWVDKVDAGLSPEALYGKFYDSAEYTNKNMSNAAYVKSLYSCVLFRNADAGGAKAWTTRLDDGMSRSAVLSGFTNSIEYKSKIKNNFTTAIQQVKGASTSRSVYTQIGDVLVTLEGALLQYMK
jgi:hypothetical protein